METNNHLSIPPELIEAVGDVLHEGESMQAFVDSAIRSAVESRRIEDAFQARGDAAWVEYQRAGASTSAAEVFDEVNARISRRRQQLQP
ncbi:MAG: hypothetical protein RLY71_772 [Pseudomonadota bacterium]|jgi:hypothetical protein